MARQKGVIQFIGSIGDLSFYERNGSYFVRTKPGMSRERLMNDPCFERSRENMSEFGLSSHAGKVLRNGLSSIIKRVGDGSIVNRVSSCLRKMIGEGSGARGKRDLNILNHGNLLIGLELNKNRPFGEVISGTLQAPEVNVSRTEVVWTIPDFNTDLVLSTPPGASHFKFILATSILGDYYFDSSLNKYLVADAALNGKGAYDEMIAPVALGGMVGSSIVLIASSGLAGVLPLTVAQVAAICVVFYQEVDGEFYELEDGKSGKIVLVT